MNQLNHSLPPPAIADKNCKICPRLCEFRERNRQLYPQFFNGAVPSFGELSAQLLIVGLAPGLKGANASGRPFTGDYAGDVLYGSLLKNGLAEGKYGATPADGLKLINTRITNAVRCVPPENKPESSEIKNCNHFLHEEIAAMPNLRVILALGGISHKAVLLAFGLKQSVHKFAHGAEFALLPSSTRHPFHSSRHPVSRKAAAQDLDPAQRLRRSQDDDKSRGEQANDSITLIDSYHCSRYNINTGRLTQEMFDGVVGELVAERLSNQ